MRITRVIVSLSLTATLLAPVVADPPPEGLSWWTIAGGGGTATATDGAVLTGVIGQHSTNVLQAGDATLIGGFLAAPTACAPGGTTFSTEAHDGVQTTPVALVPSGSPVVMNLEEVTFDVTVTPAAEGLVVRQRLEALTPGAPAFDTVPCAGNGPGDYSVTRDFTGQAPAQYRVYTQYRSCGTGITESAQGDLWVRDLVPEVSSTEVEDYLIAE